MAESGVKEKPQPAERAADGVTRIRGVRARSLPYLLIWLVYYAWVIVFTTWWTASPLPGSTFGTGLRNILHSVNLLASAVFIFVLRREWFVRSARIGAAALVVSMAVYAAAGESRFAAAAAAVIGVALGCVNISILVPFVFRLNNTEKFYAVVGSNLLIGLLTLLRETRAERLVPGPADLLLSFLLLAAGLSAVLFFRPGIHDAGPPLPSAPMPRMAYLTLMINCVFAVLCKGAGTGILDLTAASSPYPLFVCNALGGLAGCLACIAVYRFSKKSIQLAWNLTFACLAMGLFCNALGISSRAFTIGFALLLGFGNTLGMINMYYILGVIAKKYLSWRYAQLSVLFIGICGGVAGVAAGNLICDARAVPVSVGASAVCAGVMLLMLILSPMISQSYFGDEWVADSRKAQIENGPDALFARYHLSRREGEVCRLLLRGFTLRQISAMLSIGYPTVNTYCTSLYRKLAINSRTELLILFREHIRRE